MAVVGIGEILVQPSMKDFQRDVGAEVAGLEKSGPVKKAGGKFGKALQTAAKVGLAGGAVAIGTALTKGFGRLKSIEQAQATLTGLGHSAQSVEQIMQNTNTAVKGTAFGLGDAATVAAQLVASGIKPGQELEKTLTLVGDSATIAGVGISDMGAIFSKAAASNKVQMDIIGQLHDAGVPALQLIAKEMGVTAEEASEMASKGEVDFATFEKAMTQGMGGAAQESGKTLSGAFDNSMAAVGRFGANLIQDVYPQLTEFFNGFIEWMGPVEEMGKVIGESLGDALRNFTDWVKENKDTIQSLIPVVATAAGGLAAYFAITKTMAAFKAIQAWYAATTVAQKGLNAAMKANPIGLIITAITLLVGAIVWLYNNNETARKIIDAAWNGIKNGIKAAVDWIVGAWNNVVHWLTVTLPDGFNDLKNNVTNVWNNIWSKISGVWAQIKGVFDFIKLWVTVRLTAAWYLLKTTVTNVWDGIKAKISNVWSNVKSTFNNIKNFLYDTLGPVFRWLKDKVIDPVWNGIKTVIKNVWENNIKPVFTAIMQLLKGDFKGAFQTAKDAIDRIWKGVANVVRKPINFVINTVYNDGIRSVFNKVAGIVGINKLDAANEIPAFAKGGLHKGGWALVGEEGPELVNFGSPGRVYTAAETQAMLAGQAQAPAGAFDGLSAAGMLSPAHAGIGGFWGDLGNGIKTVARKVGDTMKKGLDWVRGGLAKAAEWVLNPLLGNLGSDLGSQGFGGMAGGLAKKAIEGAISWLKGKDSEASSDGGAMFYDGPLGSFAKPANGPITSGFGTSRGRYPHAGIDFAVGIGSAVRAMLNGVVRKIGTNAVTGRTGKGMVLDHANGLSSYYGHLSGWGKKPGDKVSAGERIASSGNTGRSTGPHLHAELWNKGKPFNFMSYLHDNGGVLNPGLSMIMNNTRKPEAIYNHEQNRALQTLAQHAARNLGGGGLPDVVTLSVEGHDFKAYVSTVTDGRMREAKRDARRGNRQLTGQG